MVLLLALATFEDAGETLDAAVVVVVLAVCGFLTSVGGRGLSKLATEKPECCLSVRTAGFGWDSAAGVALADAEGW